MGLNASCWADFRRYLRHRRFYVCWIGWFIATVGVSICFNQDASESKETTARHAVFWQVWGYFASITAALISYEVSKVSSKDKKIIGCALNDRLRDGCENYPLLPGEIKMAVRFYSDFREDIRLLGIQRGNHQGDAMAIVLKSAVSTDDDGEIVSLLNETDNWFGVLPGLSRDELSHFRRLLNHPAPPGDPNLIALLARDGDTDTKETAMSLLEQSRHHDSLVTLIANPDAREMVLAILKRADDFKPTFKQTSTLLETLACLDVNSEGYGGIARLIADKCLEHVRNGSNVANTLWDSILLCRGSSLGDTWKILASRTDDDTGRKLDAVLDQLNQALAGMTVGTRKTQFEQQVESVAAAYYDRFPVWA